MPSKGTAQTKIRLTATDLAAVDLIRARLGLPSAAAAIRQAIHQAATDLAAIPVREIPKKFRPPA